MNLPKDSLQKTKQHTSKKQIWIVVLAIGAIVISLASAGFSAFVYFNTPLQIHNYVESRKDDLKGEKGDRGMRGFNGASGRNSYSPTYCSTYDYSFGSSASCY